MQLFCNRPSPYGRKVLVTAHESGVFDKIAIKDIDPWADSPEFLGVVPVGKIPALVTEDGRLLTESLLICEFLWTLGGHARMAANASVDVMSRAGLTQGLIDAAFVSVIERRRPEDRQWASWIDRQRRAIARALAVTMTPPPGRFDLGDISLACGLAYLNFRLPDLEWQSQHPELARWLRVVSDRPSMVATAP